MKERQPRERQQLALKKFKPGSFFTYDENGDIFKLILVVPGEHRAFIYLNKSKSVTEAKEQLANEYLIKVT